MGSGAASLEPALAGGHGMPMAAVPALATQAWCAGPAAPARHHWRWASSFTVCPTDPAEESPDAGPAPPCIDGGSSCRTREEKRALHDFARRVDKSVKHALEDARNLRKNFEQRACDYQYAQIMDKDDELVSVYGPNGPMNPGGSYLYALERWTDAVKELYRACSRGNGGCKTLLEHFRRHPEDDAGEGGVHGKAGSGAYTEFRLACAVGENRTPVPNDSPVWCDSVTGVCEQPSCRKWWRAIHAGPKKPGQVPPEPDPWHDDRPAYDELKDICAWTKSSRPSMRDMDDYNKQLTDRVSRMKDEFCVPRWIEGYCEPKSAASSDLNTTANRGERFPERPVRSASLPIGTLSALLGPAGLPVLCDARGARSTRETSAMREFL